MLGRVVSYLSEIVTAEKTEHPGKYTDTVMNSQLYYYLKRKASLWLASKQQKDD